MADQRANTASYSFNAPNLEAGKLKVVDFKGKEGLSQLYRFEINLIADSPDIPYESVLNEGATFVREGLKNKAQIHGIVSEFELGAESSSWYEYNVVLVPHFWTLTLNFLSQPYLNKSVPEIIQEVLDRNGFGDGVDYELRLNQTYEPRAYCVQYKETDFNFISRLMEHEGIFYFFDHSGDRETLIITDDHTSFPTVPGNQVLFFHRDEGMVAKAEAIYDFSFRQKLVTGKVVLTERNSETPTEGTIVAESDPIDGNLPWERHEHDQHFLKASEGKRLATIRSQEIDSNRNTYKGESSYLLFGAGSSFSLDKHYRSSFNADYIVVSIEHEGSQGGGIAQVRNEKDKEIYKNTFACIPATVAFRPQRKATSPVLPGILTAMVESSGGGQYAYLDDNGYYRFKTFFDQTSAGDGAASAPVPAMQHNSGPGYGVHFPYHKDREVIWACIDGNPDRPILLGGRPNPTDKSPTNVDNRWENVIRTSAGNLMIMDDQDKKARILLQTAEQNKMVFNDDEDNITISSTNAHELIMDDKNEQLKVQTTSGHFMVFDDKNKKVTLQSKEGHRISINDQDENITVVDESGENTFVIDIKNKKIVIKTENGDMDLHAPNGTIDILATTLNIETTGDTTLTAANIATEAQGDHEMKASNITAEASMEFSQKGMNVTSEASMEHKTKGMNVASEAGSSKK